MQPPARTWITVVSGVPRSGTSLVMQMLAAGGLPILADASRPADEHNPRGYLEYAPVKSLRSDASWLPRARGQTLKVIHALVTALPENLEYRLVLVRRELREVVASQQAMLGPEAGAGPSPQRLVEIFAAQLAELEAWLASRPQFRVLRVDFATLLVEPARVAAELSAFLGGGLDEDAMAAVVDPDLHRQRRQQA